MHHRKSNCSLQNARAEKAVWWGARWHGGLVPKVLSSNCSAFQFLIQRGLTGVMRYGWKGGKPPSQTPHLGLGDIEAAPQLVRLSAKSALPCEDRQHRKINCTLQNAVVHLQKKLHVGGGCDVRSGVGG